MGAPKWTSDLATIPSNCLWDGCPPPCSSTTPVAYSHGAGATPAGHSQWDSAIPLSQKVGAESGDLAFEPTIQVTVVQATNSTSRNQLW